jgi:hypothetical protein
VFNRNPLRQLALLTCVLTAPGSLFANKTQDPMRPPNFNPASTTSVTATAVKQWDITEILISEERRIAVINDTPVKTGDTINNARVISINTDHVVLSKNNITFKQYLPRIPVKQQTLPGTDPSYE